MARTKAGLSSGARLADYLSASLMARAVPPQVVHEVLDAHGRNSRTRKRGAWSRDNPSGSFVFYVDGIDLEPRLAHSVSLLRRVAHRVMLFEAGWSM